MKDHIIDGKVYIDREDLAHMKDTMGKEEIKQHISDLIRDNDVPLPYRKISRQEAEGDFLSLQQQEYVSLIEDGDWVTRYDYDPRWYKVPIIFSMSRTGNKSSDFFHQENRWLCDSINSPSPYRTWNEERFRLTLLNAIWGLKIEEITTKTLRSMIALRKYIASQFRPSTAKAIIEFFEADRVLDFSAGWGDRLSGFMASSASHYTGIDPNERSYSIYFEQVEAFGGDKSIDLINTPAEDADISGTYDLIFTSPPYFNIERYTQEDNQSFKRYKKIDQWLNGFLFATLEKCWNLLDEGGHMVINISDVYSNHQINRICDPMNEFISTLEGAEYQGCMCYEMAKRPNSKSMKGKEGKFGEPIWVWKKGECP